jgi:hypothetical protein
MLELLTKKEFVSLAEVSPYFDNPPWNTLRVVGGLAIATGAASSTVLFEQTHRKRIKNASQSSWWSTTQISTLISMLSICCPMR